MPMTGALPTSDQLPAAVQEGLARLAADAVGPFGRTPLSWLVTNHLPVFSELLQLNASWAQQAALLANIGIEGTDGPFSAAVLRATYARAAAAAARGMPISNRTKRNETSRDEAQRDDPQRNEAKRSETKCDGAQLNETIPEMTGSDVPERGATNANAAPTAQNSRPDRTTAADDGLARRAMLIHKPLHTR